MNNRTLKLNNDIPKGNSSVGDTSCIVQPPGHAPTHVAQVCVRDRVRGEGKEETWREQTGLQGQRATIKAEGGRGRQFVPAPSQGAGAVTTQSFLSDI